MYFKIIFCLIFFIFLGGFYLQAQQDPSQDENQDFLQQPSQDQKRQIYLLKSQLIEIQNEEKLKEQNEKKNGFFLGLGGGVSSTALKIGYAKTWIGNNIGMRSYLEHNSSYQNDIWYQFYSGNLDIITDILLDSSYRYGLSFFGGVGFGVAQRRIDFFASGFLNFGVGVIMNLFHRIELGLKLPIGLTKDVDSSYLLLLSYLYKF